MRFHLPTIHFLGAMSVSGGVSVFRNKHKLKLVGSQDINFTELELELQNKSPKGWLIHRFVRTVTVALSIKKWKQVTCGFTSF